jgi:mRNA-degrading endonuclease YafQ of YafQ-DinJ toxin-antitoxin module
MKICYSSKFLREYQKLPLSVKKLAEAKEKIFRKNPFDPRLKTHKLKGGLNEFLSFSINNQYRIIFEFRDPPVVWFHSVGDHSIYRLWD